MAYVRISKVSARSTDNSNVTTGAIDTTGANRIVIAVAYSAGTTFNVTDSKGNTYTGLTARVGGTASVRLFDCLAPSVGAAHTFTVTGTSGTPFPGIAASAYSGAKTVGAFDQENGATSAGSTTLATGSVTPSEDNELLIAGVCYNSAAAATIDVGFTAIESQGVTANSWGIGMGELIQTTAAAKNPTWTQGSAVAIAAAIATFKAQAVAGSSAMFEMFD